MTSRAKGAPPAKLADVLANGVDAVHSEHLPALLAQATALQGALLARLLADEPNRHRDLAPAPEDRLLTVHEAAKRLGMSRDWAYRHARALGGVKLGNGSLRFPPAALDAYIARKRAEMDAP